jgi:hypothetical protein
VGDRRLPALVTSPPLLVPVRSGRTPAGGADEEEEEEDDSESGPAPSESGESDLLSSIGHAEVVDAMDEDEDEDEDEDVGSRNKSGGSTDKGAGGSAWDDERAGSVPRAMGTEAVAAAMQALQVGPLPPQHPSHAVIAATRKLQHAHQARLRQPATAALQASRAQLPAAAHRDAIVTVRRAAGPPYPIYKRCALHARMGVWDGGACTRRCARGPW